MRFIGISKSSISGSSARAWGNSVGQPIAASQHTALELSILGVPQRSLLRKESSVASTQPSAPVRLLLTVPEVASALGVGRNVVYELILTGQLASIKIGRLRRVPVGAVETFINVQLTTFEGRRS